MITLTGAGRVTQWRYPKQNWKNCPFQRCSKKFDLRSTAIAHYQTVHAHKMIACPICVRPISATVITALRHHYRRMHGNVKFPLDIGRSSNISCGSSQTAKKKVHILLRTRINIMLVLTENIFKYRIFCVRNDFPIIVTYYFDTFLPSNRGKPERRNATGRA